MISLIKELLKKGSKNIELRLEGYFSPLRGQHQAQLLPVFLRLTVDAASVKTVFPSIMFDVAGTINIRSYEESNVKGSLILKPVCAGKFVLAVTMDNEEFQFEILLRTVLKNTILHHEIFWEGDLTSGGQTAGNLRLVFPVTQIAGMIS